MGMLERGITPEFFDQSGLKRLTPEQERTVSLHYKSELLSGLRGDAKSVAMSPSGLSSTELNSLREGSEALVIEIGGTNLYGARVAIQCGNPFISASHKGLLPTTIFKNAQEFYKLVADNMRPVLKEHEPDAIGIVYSFPGMAIKVGRDVDVISPENLPKEFVIPGISNKRVGQALRETLHNLYGAKVDVPTVVLNDTVAVLFSAGAKIGGVVGTGFNLAMETPKGIVNSESGGFAIALTNRFAEAVDKQSNNVGKQLAEKQVSGLYLGEQMRLIVDELKQQGLNIDIPSKTITAKTISDLLQYQGTDGAQLILQEAASRLRDRSAQIVGIMAGTIIASFPEVFDADVIKFPVEGSLFWRMPGYSEKVMEVAQRLSQREIRFLNIVGAGRIGAAVAALGNIPQKV